MIKDNGNLKKRIKYTRISGYHITTKSMNYGHKGRKRIPGQKKRNSRSKALNTSSVKSQQWMPTKSKGPEENSPHHVIAKTLNIQKGGGG